MFKKTFLFITTFFTAASVSTGYGATDSLKGTVNVTTFLDWFNSTEKYVPVTGLIVLDLIPILFLIVQATLFFKDRKKLKGILTVAALLANLIGVFLIIQYANPIASQMKGWTAGNTPSDWISLKDEWLNNIGLSGLLGIAGWLCFVITYFVPARKQEGVKQLPRFLNFSKNALLFFLTFVLGMGATRLYDAFFFSLFV
ncbi:hypothetical protein [Lacibacter sp. H407]|uniref:hypothetical protein n=1 Tax=Lacibacter sp. H407 TaxID=3133423 RepID=UPI0030C3F1A8